MRISVTTPTYGRPDKHPLLYRCFAGQSWADKELIVLDDSPSPSAFFTQLEDPSVRYIHSETKQNIGEKRNRLASLATGELIAHFDDDDYYGPNYLSAMANKLGDAGLVRLAGWFIYSQAQSRLWYWDQRTIAAPIHYRLMGGRNLDAMPVNKLSTEDQETWIKDNLSGWGFSFMYPKAVYDQVQFEEVSHGEEGLFTQGIRKLGYDVIQAVDTEALAIVIRHAQDNSNLFPQYALPDFLIDRLFEPDVREFLEHR
ncbi:MAG: glycosyltransferase [Myxococcota bacterium]|nr:glycosyltransferase [Myxococcota bacterium]